MTPPQLNQAQSTLSSLLVWLARSCGVGHELAARIDRVEWHWARPDLLIIGLLLLVPAGWWIARRHRERMPWLSPRQRYALSACRIAVLALLVFVLAGPSLRLDERVEEKPVVALIVDTSDSMQLPEYLAQEAQNQLLALQSPDHGKALQAFLQSRKTTA